MVDESVRWGILSTAGIAARALIPALRESASGWPLAVASRDRNRAARFAADHGIPRSYGSYEELLADEEIEAVYVPLPNTLHVEWSIRALEAGKHVLCEKPMDANPHEVERAFRAAEAGNRLLMEALMWRHHLDTLAIVKLIESGAIGEVRHVRSTASFTLAAGENLRLDPALGGGALRDLACYPVSAARLFGGEPSFVSARFVVGRTGVDQSVVALMACENGRTSTIFASFEAAPVSVIEIIGTERVLVMHWPFAPFVPARIELRARDRSEPVVSSTDNRYRRQVDNFSDAIRGRADPLLGREDAVAQARVIGAIEQSALNGGAGVAL